MHDIALFVEDFAHRQVIGTLVQRIAGDFNLDVRLDWRNATRGYGQVVREFNTYLRAIERQGHPSPDMIIVATDANCKGRNQRIRDFADPVSPAPIVHAIPDPHIERWLLLDGAAFKAVFGRGCDAPDQKCDRYRYKQRLVHAIFGAGITPNLGGMEFAEDIVQHMDIERAELADDSFGRFVGSLRTTFRGWNP